MTATSFSDGDTFRFRRADQRRGIYLAVRQMSYWHVTLEGNSDPWMFWVLSDENVLANCWGNRLTD